MRKAAVYDNNILAGFLTETDDREYVFQYTENYLNDSSTFGISLTMPKREQEYREKYLFPFFFNMLSEGANKDIQITYFKLDEEDYFGHLLATAGHDTIGSVTVKAL